MTDLELARRAAKAGLFDEAYRHYSFAMAEDPDSWECRFYAGYYRAISVPGDIAGSAQAMESTITASVKLLGRLDPIARATAAAEMADATIKLFSSMVESLRKIHNGRTSNEYASILMVCKLVDSLAQSYPNESLVKKTCGMICQPLLTCILQHTSQFDILTTYGALNSGGVDEEKILTYMEYLAFYDKDIARPKIQEVLDKRKQALKEETKHKYNYSIGQMVFGFVAGGMIAIPAVSMRRKGEVLWIFCALCILLGIIAGVPKPFSKKAKEATAREVAKLTSQIERMENMLK